MVANRLGFPPSSRSGQAEMRINEIRRRKFSFGAEMKKLWAFVLTFGI
jgi:hypothetical protein